MKEAATVHRAVATTPKVLRKEDLVNIQHPRATVATPNDLDAYWMPFTSNRSFKRKPRMLAGAKDMHYFTTDGRSITGRIVNLSGDTFKVNTNMLDPDAQTNVDRSLIEELIPSKVSMMPEGLLNTLQRVEVLDLFAYLLSRGDRNHPAFNSSSPR